MVILSTCLSQSDTDPRPGEIETSGFYYMIVRTL